MSLLCRAVLIAIKNSNENGTESEEEGSSNEVIFCVTVNGVHGMT